MKDTIRTKRLMAAALALLSLLLLLSNWIVTSGRSQFDLSGFHSSLDKGLRELESASSLLGTEISTKGFRRAADSLIDGKLSPPEAVSLADQSTKLVRKLEKSTSLVSGLLSEFLPDFVAAVKSLRTLSVLLIFVFMGVIASGVLCVVSRITDRLRELDYAFFAMQILLLLLFVYLCAIAGKHGLSCRITLWSLLAVVLSLPYAFLDKLFLTRLFGPDAAEKGVRGPAGQYR